MSSSASRWAANAALALVALVSAQAANGQGLLHLYREALANNSVLALRDLEVERARAEAAVVGSRLKPRVDAQASISAVDYHSSGGATAAATNSQYGSGRASITARQTLWDQASSLRHEAAQRAVLRGEADASQARMTMAVELLERYLSALQAQDGLKATRAESEAVRRQVERLQFMRERQLAKVTDLAEAQAYASSLETRQLDLSNQFEVSLARLAEITQSSVSQPERLLRQSFEPLDADHERWVTLALTQNTRIKSLEQGVEAARLQWAAARADGRPSVALVANTVLSDQGFDQLRQNRYRSTSVGLEVQIPLYNAGRNDAAAMEADARHRIAGQQLEAARRELRREVRTAWLSARGNQARMASTDNEVRAREGAVLALEKGFELGANSIINVLDARQKLLQARTEQAKARYDFIRDWAALNQRTQTLDDARMAQMAAWFGAGP